MQKSYDVIVIGGGPAGCSAATYVARCRWKVVLIDSSLASGYLGGLGTVGFFPGFPEPIGGAELVKKMRRQAELVGVQFVFDTVTALAADTKQPKVLTDGGKEFEARVVIVATGAAARTNYLFGEREFLGKGVFYDAVADGPAVAKRTVAVIGKTRQAVDEAITLVRFAEKIHLIVPSNKIEVDEAMINRLHQNRTIEVHMSTSLKKINGADHVRSITVFSGGQEKEMPVAGVFTYVHEYKATTTFLDKVVEMGSNGVIKVSSTFATSAEGVYACGDVLCGKPQLPAVAAAQGLLAGVSVDQYLNSGDTILNSGNGTPN